MLEGGLSCRMTKKGFFFAASLTIGETEKSILEGTLYGVLQCTCIQRENEIIDDG